MDAEICQPPRRIRFHLIRGDHNELRKQSWSVGAFGTPGPIRTADLLLQRQIPSMHIMSFQGLRICKSRSSWAREGHSPSTRQRLEYRFHRSARTDWVDEVPGASACGVPAHSGAPNVRSSNDPQPSPALSSFPQGRAASGNSANTTGRKGRSRDPRNGVSGTEPVGSLHAFTVSNRTRRGLRQIRPCA